MDDRGLTVPFKLTPAVPVEARHAHMHYAIRHGFPRLQQQPMGSGVLSVVCYGPSLADTWQDIPRPILTVSGAHNYLLERGIVPDYHAEMDPRHSKLAHLAKPQRGVRYLMASVCHPLTWRQMEGFDVMLWHTVSGKSTEAWLEEHDPGSVLVAGGSSIGLSAMHIGGLLGYRRFRVFGMDGCFRGDARHAGPHYGPEHGRIVWTLEGEPFVTSQIMQNSNQEFINMHYMFPIFSVVHGDGLLQRMCAAHPQLNNLALAGTPKAERVLSARYVELMEMEIA